MMREILGRLLQLQGELAGTFENGSKSQRTIQTIRSARLREGLENVGVRVTAEVAQVLSDGFATGQVGIGPTAVYLSADGNDGMEVDCGCKPPILAPFLACEMKVVAGAIWCLAPAGSACPSCKLTVGVQIPTRGSISLGSDAETLGDGFFDGLRPSRAAAIRALSRLKYPVNDRLELGDQLQSLKLKSRRSFASLAFPLATQADAFTKLLERETGNLLRLAVGDYEDTMIRQVAGGLAAGSFEVDGGKRTVRVAARPISPAEPSAKIKCVCLGDDGECNYVLNPEGNKLTCEGSCQICESEITIPLSALDGLAMR